MKYESQIMDEYLTKYCEGYKEAEPEEQLLARIALRETIAAPGIILRARIKELGQKVIKIFRRE